MFYNNNEAMPTYEILTHVCIKGLKTEKSYIIEFSRENFFEIENRWIESKEKIRKNGGFPKSFFNQIFKLRADYRKGISVVIV